jgi:hypothetical protein
MQIVRGCDVQRNVGGRAAMSVMNSRRLMLIFSGLLSQVTILGLFCQNNRFSCKISPPTFMGCRRVKSGGL